ncbi:hypothetical protein HPB50_014830 [Hyalomma asiaticum]|uniref:Uncharacterized protein n=1 Tax=Hyalomma asiaticum TaxID=266040 RepID=A0ACB7TL51_HYAAI|nr:hypothetical protein HPB50_014830 [Hyalomma asiaticum]
MLRQNRSLHRLEIHWTPDDDYDSFKTHLSKGLSLNMSVFIVKQFFNEVLHVPSDFELLQPIRRNSMILAWVIDLILRDKLYPAGAAVVDMLNTCEAYRDLFRSAADFSPRTTEDRKCVARKAARTQLYTLLSVFRGHPDFCLKADGKTRLDNLLYSMRGQVLKAIESSQETSGAAAKVQVAKILAMDSLAVKVGAYTLLAFEVPRWTSPSLVQPGRERASALIKTRPASRDYLTQSPSLATQECARRDLRAYAPQTYTRLPARIGDLLARTVHARLVRAPAARRQLARRGVVWWHGRGNLVFGGVDILPYESSPPSWPSDSASLKEARASALAGTTGRSRIGVVRLNALLLPLLLSLMLEIVND